MAASDVLAQSALTQAGLIRDGHLSSEELTRLYLDRIERLNPRLQAFVDVFRRRALLAARVKDTWRRARKGRPLPPFHGVPLGVKDLNIVRGAPTRFGSRAMPHLVLPVDDYNVAALRRGGFVLLGKLSTSELGAMPVTEPDIHPPTRNPWAPDHTAGGSSGGSGSAVAAGMLPIAQGSDGAGSIRIPAAFCHLYGLKPSRGRVKNQFGMRDRHILYTSGPLAHTVEDAAAMLDLLAGLGHGGRPHWAPPPDRPYRELYRLAPRRMRIRFSTKSPLSATHPEIKAGVERAAKLLAGLGHDVEEATLPEGTLEEFLPLWQRLMGNNPVARWRYAQPITRWLAQPGRKLPAAQVHARYRELVERLRPPLEEPDVWLTPTVAQPPPRVGRYGGRPPDEAFADAAQIAAFTAAFNITGQPAASVPMGLTSEGLPMGLQVGARNFAEVDVLQLSRQLEEAMPWAHRRAPEGG
jgi:amidase